MLKKSVLDTLLFFDVETAGATKDLSELAEINPRLAKIWSEKRSNYYRSNYIQYKDASDNEIFLEKAGLEPEFLRVVCVSFGVYEMGSVRLTSFYGEDEKTILEKTNKVLENSTAKGMKICGHNIKGFDIPCLGKRMIYNGIKPSSPLMIWNKKPWEVDAVDTSEVFAFGSYSQRYLSLDLLSCSLGVESPKDDLEGSLVHSTFWAGKHEEIKSYCERDVETVISVLEKTAF